MSMVITVVSYRPNGDDYCRGCHMASSSSDFDLQETADAEQAAGWVADKLMADHKAKNSPEVDEWQVTILIDGASYGHDADDDNGHAEEVREDIRNRARLLLATRLDEERQKKEAEQARLVVRIRLTVRMRVFKPIPSKLIPTAAPGRPRNPRYDALIAHTQKLPVGQAYPVECSDCGGP